MDYIKSLKDMVEKLHNCEATHTKSVMVKEHFQGVLVWDGMVEIFELKNHPKAVRCYAWSTKSGDKDKVTAVLEIPPVDSALTAVRVSIVQEMKEKK